MIVGDGPLPVATDDASLAYRTQAGDAEAFGVLYGRYYRRVQNICINYAKGQPDVVEDLVHDAFTKLLDALRRGLYQESGRFDRFLSRLATRICLDYVRKASTSTEIPTGLGQHGDSLAVLAEFNDFIQSDEALDTVLENERRETARRLLEALPDKEAAAVVLASTGVSMKQSSVHLGATVSAVKARLWRARAIAEVLILTDVRFEALRPEGMSIRRASRSALPNAYRLAREATADA